MKGNRNHVEEIPGEKVELEAVHCEFAQLKTEVTHS